MKQGSWTPAIIDIEASGFGQHSYPIEIGVINSQGASYRALIRPDDDWLDWSADAEAIHGISRYTLLTKGLPVRQVCNELNDFLFGSTVYSDAWSHDQRWLMKLFYCAEIIQHFKLSPIESIISERQFSIWDGTKALVIEKLGLDRHHACNDARIIQQTFLESRLLELA